MLVAQITDVHIGFERNNPDEPNMQRLRAVIDRLVAGPNRPDLLLMTGDLTESGDEESYRLLAEAVSHCPFPVHAMTGNHDLREPLLAAFPQTGSADGFVQYVIAGQGLRLIVLDTLETGRHGGGFCEARAAWLAERLDEDREMPTLLAMHHPPFESGIAWLDGSEAEPWMTRFASVAGGRPNVRGIIAGHLHRTIHTVWNGYAASVCPSTAPAVALDLRPLDSGLPDGRAMITGELPAYALHRWNGQRLVSHVETVDDVPVLASYDARFQHVVRHIEAERTSG